MIVLRSAAGGGAHGCAGRGAAAGRAALLSLLTLFAALAAPVSASAGDNQWTPVGSLPGDAPIFSLAFDPVQSSTLLAATVGAGLVRTTDGHNWRDIGGSNLPRELWKVALDDSRGPGGAAPIYVGSVRHGFFRSLDGGRSWKEGNSGLVGGALNVRSIALGRGLLVIGTSDGAYKSTDGGASWQRAGLAGMEISSVAFAAYGIPGSSANPPVVIAGIDGTRTPGSHLARSADLGATWVPLKGGLPADLVVSAVAAGPLPSGATLRPLFVAGSGGLYKSDDGGDTWAQEAGLPQNQGFGAVALSSADPNVVYVASDAGGGSAGGVWRSSDRGGTWSGLTTGLASHGVTALALGHAAAATLAAAAYDPGRHLVVPYLMSDTGVTPAGTPEGGVCPEAQTCPTADPDPLPTGGPSSPVVGPVPPPVCGAVATPSASPSAATSPLPSAGPSSTPAAVASAPPTPSAGPSCAPAPPPLERARNGDVPLWIGGGVVALLLLLLGIRLVAVRR